MGKKILKKINKLYVKIYTKKQWHNISGFCNRKTHPVYFGYRVYRRGKNRCEHCGAKIGKIKCKSKSLRELLVENVYGETPLLNLIRRK